MEVRVEGAEYESAPKDNTGKPDLPRINVGKPQRAVRVERNTPPTAFRYESYLLNTGSLLRGAKGSGSR